MSTNFPGQFNGPDPLKSANEFFDLSNIDHLDDQLAARMGKENLIDKMQAQSDKVSARRQEWAAEFKKHWFIYVLLFLSAIFTGTLGIYMGLAPYRTTDAITGIQKLVFNDDTAHLLLAFVYLVAFVGTTEVQVAIGKRLFNNREENNQTQKNTMIAVMILGIIGIIGTGWAGGMIVASNISFLTEYVEISPAAQAWVVKAIPVFIAIYTVLYSMYAMSSEALKTERITRENKRKADLAHQTRMEVMQQIASEHIQGSDLNLLIDAVKKGNLPAQRAIKAIQDGKSLSQLELEDNQDIDKNGRIGTASASPALNNATQRPGPIASKSYTMRSYLAWLGQSLQGFYNFLETNDLADGNPLNAWDRLGPAGYIPEDMDQSNFQGVYLQILQPFQRSGSQRPVNPPSILKPSARMYTLLEFLDFVGITEEIAVNWIGSNHLLMDPGTAYTTMKVGGYFPDDMTEANFIALHAELVSKIPVPGNNGNTVKPSFR